MTRLTRRSASRSISSTRLRALACAILTGLAAAAMLAVFAQRLAWLLANLLFLFVPAAALVTIAREIVRLGVARSFRFRAFGLQFGIGPVLYSHSLRGLQLRWAAIPIGGDDRFASALPARHRAGRVAQCAAPLVVQGVGALAAALSVGVSPLALTAGWAPLEALQLANLFLLGVHGLLPLDTRSGLTTDLRRLGHLAFSTTESDRAARALALAMGIERHLSRGDVGAARRVLASGIAQLGREAVLVELERRLDDVERSPEPSSAARIGARTNPFDRTRAAWNVDGPVVGLPRRTLRAAVGLVPATVVTLFVGAHQYDALIRHAHARWIDEAMVLAVAGDRAACATHLETYGERLDRLTWFAVTTRPLQVRELRARATLHACAGDFDRAVRDQSLAVEIADAIRRRRTDDAPVDSRARIDAELMHSSELRQLAAWYAARGAYRDALKMTRRAEEDLGAAGAEARVAPSSPQREWALGMLARERQQLESTRRQILSGMNVRG